MLRGYYSLGNDALDPLGGEYPTLFMQTNIGDISRIYGRYRE